MKNILITGSGGHLGKAVTEVLHAAGYQIIGTINHGSKKPDGAAHYYECDLMDEIETKELFDQLKVKYKSLHAAILLVGGFGMGNISESSANDIKKMFGLNFITTYNCAQNALNWMKQSHGGNIVMVGAKPAVDGGGAAVLPYAISKNAVAKLSEFINEGTKETGVRSSVIVPSIIDTKINREAMSDANFDDWVKPEKIAESIKFLIAEESSVLRDPVLKLYNNS